MLLRIAWSVVLAMTAPIETTTSLARCGVPPGRDSRVTGAQNARL